MSITLHTPVSHLPGIGEAYARILSAKGIHTLENLLLHFPLSYIDTTCPSTSIRISLPRLYLVHISKHRLVRLFPRRRSLVKVEGRINKQPVKVVFFNRPYMAKNLSGLKEMLVYGFVEKHENALQLVNPQWIPQDLAGRILPIYTPLSTLTSGRLRRIISASCARLDKSDDPLPKSLCRQRGLPGAEEAFRSIHVPAKPGQGYGAEARKRFIYSEFFFYHLEVQAVRHSFRNRKRRHEYRWQEKLRQAISRALPFVLTPGQEKVFEEIVSDLLSPLPMTRLLQGEVGSGKTIVAFLALLVASANGYQAAFLAPTEILASQHFQNARLFFKDSQVALLTGSTPPAEHRRIVNGLETGDIAIVFGTHALLHAGIRFRQLALITIDEQHRFGVAQRAALYCKGRSVDLLVTTATPIPRTLQLALYGDMSISTLHREKGRQTPIATRVIEAGRRDAFYRWLQKKVKAGEKGYIVLPLIERSEFFVGLRSLEEEKEYFQSLFSGTPWSTLSGRHKGDDKTAVLERLRSGAIRILVATTVIEVGIDVPDATFIVIENADRYGLAQLHQMRGRVGRAGLPGSCFLIASPAPTPSGRKRMESMLETDDGFRIAEMDLQLRGSGKIAGHEQCGLPEFHVGDPADHLELFQAAEDDAQAILGKPKEHTPSVSAVLESVKKKIASLSFS